MPVPIEHDGIIARGIEIFAMPGHGGGGSLKAVRCMYIVGTASQHPPDISAAVPILVAEEGDVGRGLSGGSIGGPYPYRNGEIVHADEGVLEVDELFRINCAVLQM